MNRRKLLKLAGTAGLVTKAEAAAQERVSRAVRGMPSPKIKDVRVIATSQAGLRLAVVKIVTDQDGLYGYGCATFTQPSSLHPDGRYRGTGSTLYLERLNDEGKLADPVASQSLQIQVLQEEDAVSRKQNLMYRVGEGLIRIRLHFNARVVGANQQRAGLH